MVSIVICRRATRFYGIMSRPDLSSRFYGSETAKSIPLYVMSTVSLALVFLEFDSKKIE